MQMQMPTESYDKWMSNLLRGCSDMNSVMHDSMNAFLQSGTAYTRGCEEIYDSVSILVQKWLENCSQSCRAMSGVKSMREVMDMQTNMLKCSYDDMVAEMNKITQISTRTVQQTAEPVTNHVNATISKLSLVKAA